MVETLKTVLDLVRDPKQNSKLFQSNENAKMILDDIYLKYLTNPAGKNFTIQEYSTYIAMTRKL